MRALVTGGGGFLGLYVVEQLLAAGNQVRVFCRGSYDALQRDGIEVVQVRAAWPELSQKHFSARARRSFCAFQGLRCAHILKNEKS